MKLNFNLKYALLMLFIAMGTFAMAQRTVTGTVTDAETKEPLIGASVAIVGTGTGAITDFDGKFSVEVPEGSTQIQISYTGYSTQTVDLGTSNIVDVQLASGELLEEVVVVGYGTQKKKQVTGAVASIDAKDFNAGNVNDPSQLLQGKVAGLSITRPGGNPNQGFNIRLRGLSTFGANSQPLIVIDGVIGADINSVDPNDIASFDVLKDGSAAAIYGTRGSSGVIIITTKKGKPGQTTVDYNGYVAAESVDRFVPVLDADAYRNFPGSNDLGSETNWFDELTGTGISHVHNLSLSGGTENTSYRMSANFRDVEAVATSVGFQQLNGRINLEQRAINDRLKFNVDITATNRDADYGFDEAFRYATIYNPTAPVTSTESEFEQYDGYFQQTLFDYFNPVAIIEQNLNQGEDQRLIASIRGEYELMDGLKVGAFYARQNNNLSRRAYFDKNSFWVGQGRNGLARQELFKSSSDLFEVTGRYNKTFDLIDFGAVVGYSYQDFFNEGFRAEGGNFLTDATTFDNLSGAADFQNGLGTVGSYRDRNKLIAFFGRVELAYDDTYFMTANLRREGSTKFGDGNKWGLFPGISAGVNIDKLVDIDGVDQLKLRAGYGVTGNTPINSYESLLRFGPLRDGDGNPISFLYNGAYVTAYGPQSNANPNLKWEVKTDISVGIDFSLLDYKINGSLEYYNTNTDDLLLTVDVDASTNLFPQALRNLGELRNSGLELALNYNAVSTSEFTYTPSINFTYYLDAEIVSLSDNEFDYGTRELSNLGSPGQNNTPLARVAEGEPLGQIWGIVYEGIDDNGDWIFKDVDGDGQFRDTDDRAVIGNGIPDFQLGFNNSFTYKNWDFNFFLRGVFGHDLVNTMRAFYEAPRAISSYNVLESTSDVANLTANAKFSSLHVEDASFVKLDNASLGYTVDLPEGSSFRRLRLYVAGQNLFTITGYSGVDPEPRFSDPDGGSFVTGIDRRNTWFRTRTVTFGVNLGF